MTSFLKKIHSQQFRVDNPFEGKVLVFQCLRPKQHLCILLVDINSEICTPGDLVRIEREVYYVKSITNVHNHIIYIKTLPYSEFNS